MQCHICGQPATFTCQECGRAGCNAHYSKLGKGGICSKCQAEKKRLYEQEAKDLAERAATYVPPHNGVKCYVCDEWINFHHGGGICHECKQSFCQEHGVESSSINKYPLCNRHYAKRKAYLDGHYSLFLLGGFGVIPVLCAATVRGVTVGLEQGFHVIVIAVVAYILYALYLFMTWASI